MILLKIIGLRVEKYIGQAVTGHNCDFDYYDKELTRHTVCCILSNGQRIEIALTERQGECYSGWTTASWGEYEIKEVNRFIGLTHISRKEIFLHDINIDYDKKNIFNNVFSVEYDGGDHYYPSGCYNVNMDLFIETARYKEKRPVWIFNGASGMGKSYLSSRLLGLTIYETDKSDTLPHEIKDDVVVLGNKYKFSVEEIKEKLFGIPEVILVNFNTDNLI